MKRGKILFIDTVHPLLLQELEKDAYQCDFRWLYFLKLDPLAETRSTWYFDKFKVVGRHFVSAYSRLTTRYSAKRSFGFRSIYKLRPVSSNSE